MAASPQSGAASLDLQSILDEPSIASELRRAREAVPRTYKAVALNDAQE